MTTNRKIKYLLLLLVVAVIAAAGTGIYLWNKPPVKVEARKGIRLSADQLCQAFRENEAAANARYLNKAIQVKGTITEVIRNLDGGTMLILEACNGTSAIQCGMRDETGTLQKGETVAVKGFCAGQTITGVTLTGCIVVSENTSAP